MPKRPGSETVVEAFIKKVQVAHIEGDIRKLSAIYNSICCIRYINSQTIRKDRRIETNLYKKENLLLFNLMSQIMKTCCEYIYRSTGDLNIWNLFPHQGSKLCWYI